MTTIDLGQPAPDQQQMALQRSNAISEYASLEQSLAVLFSNLINPDMRVGAAIFFRMTNAKSRLTVLEELITIKFGATYRTFFQGIPGTKQKGVFSLLKTLDQRRNEIVHWHWVRVVSDAGSETVLMPPNLWSNPSRSQLMVGDLVDFALKANFVSRLLNIFGAYVYPEEAEHLAEWRRAWRDTFQQLCAYPPADTHPLSPNYVEP